MAQQSSFAEFKPEDIAVVKLEDFLDQAINALAYPSLQHPLTDIVISASEQGKKQVYVHVQAHHAFYDLIRLDVTARSRIAKEIAAKGYDVRLQVNPVDTNGICYDGIVYTLTPKQSNQAKIN